MTSSSTKLTLKLLIDTKREKVLFAEASKPVIDFLLSFLCLPLSTVARLRPKNGSLGNLYESVENLDESYIQPDQHKDLLLKPRVPISSPDISGLLSANHDSDFDDEIPETKFYMCPNQCNFSVTCNNKTICSRCNRNMSNVLHFVGNKVAEGVSRNSGFVKEVVTYMVMDDLVIQPMSTISSIMLLNKFEIKDVGVLHEKVVELGMNEGVNLLKASLESKTVLTNVFLKNRSFPADH